MLNGKRKVFPVLEAQNLRFVQCRSIHTIALHARNFILFGRNCRKAMKLENIFRKIHEQDSKKEEQSNSAEA